MTEIYENAVGIVLCFAKIEGACFGLDVLKTPWDAARVVRPRRGGPQSAALQFSFGPQAIRHPVSTTFSSNGLAPPFSVCHKASRSSIGLFLISLHSQNGKLFNKSIA